jgi:ribosomal protein L2
MTIKLTKKTKLCGRNSSGRITIFHRGGGHKRNKLVRPIDLKRMQLSVSNLMYTHGPVFMCALNTECSRDEVGKFLFFGETPPAHPPRSSLRQHTKITCDRHLLRCEVGIVQSLDYDPNRSARIALVKWIQDDQDDSEITQNTLCSVQKKTVTCWSYIIACEGLKVNDRILNTSELTHTPNNQIVSTWNTSRPDSHSKLVNLPRSANGFIYSANQHIMREVTGNCAFLSCIPLGTSVHNIEAHPGQGGQFVRSAGTFAQLIQKRDKRCVVRLPSGILKELDSKCRATIGVVSNGLHNTHKLTKAGQNRWLGRRPTVRGVAMNPIDHPHGGGEGRSGCGGRPSVSPWGKLTKGGFKTVLRKRHCVLNK